MHMSTACVMAMLQYKVHVSRTPKVHNTNACMVCSAHTARCALHSINKCELHTTYLVCFTHSKKCAYRDIAGTPYLVCRTHVLFYSVGTACNAKSIQSGLRGRIIQLSQASLFYITHILQLHKDIVMCEMYMCVNACCICYLIAP